MASIIFEDKLVLTEKERSELSRSIKHITDSLRFSRRELANANRQLSYLKEFSENIIEREPVGIATIDAFLRVKYWNRGMEVISGIRKEDSVNRLILKILPYLPESILSLQGETLALSKTLQEV